MATNARKSSVFPKMTQSGSGAELICGGRRATADLNSADAGGRERPRIRRAWHLLTLSLLLAGCELEGVAAPPAEDILVVEAVLRAGMSQQYILLHRSLEGGVVRGERGASVVVTSASGLEIAYQEADLQACLTSNPADWEASQRVEFEATCYLSPEEAGRFVVPGETYDLRIETTRGEVLRGRTTVPQTFRFIVPAVEIDPVSLDALCILPNQPFTMTWTRSEGAWAYITSLRLQSWGHDLKDAGVDVPDPLDLTSVSVSAADTSLLFPANLGLFQRFDLDQRVLLALQEGLPENGNAMVVIASADRNHVNWVRGGRFNPSGTVRGSSIAGDGVGVFGSIVPLIIWSHQITTTWEDEPEDPVPPCPVPELN